MTKKELPPLYERKDYKRRQWSISRHWCCKGQPCWKLVISLNNKETSVERENKVANRS